MSTRPFTSIFGNTARAATPIQERFPNRTDQVLNNTGGYTFPVDKWVRLERFLIIGVEGGTYYVTERKLVKENVASLAECLKENGLRVIDTILDVSTRGRAMKQDPAIFALAYAHTFGDDVTKTKAAMVMPAICRTGTALFHWAEFINQFNGKGSWGRSKRRAITNWYGSKDADKLGFQLIKYRQRDGWTHRDVLNVGHPVFDYDEKGGEFFALIDWVATGGNTEHAEMLPAQVKAYLELAEIAPESKADIEASLVKRAIKLIVDHRLPWEAVPTVLHKEKDVWAALLQDMPIHATIRNLGRLTNLGLIAPMSDATKLVVERFRDQEQIKKARLHPMEVFKNRKGYMAGRSLGAQHRANALTWTPLSKVSSALEDTFYLAFDAVEPSGKNFLIGCDVSASMQSAVNGMDEVQCNEAVAIMAMVVIRREENSHVMAFDQGIRELDLNPKMSFEQVHRLVDAINGGGTNCSLPMEYAARNNIPVDCFVVLTDNETNSGRHPFSVLREYRQKMGRPSKMVVGAMTSSYHTIADPSDAGMVDIVGFDTATPAFISDFAKYDPGTKLSTTHGDTPSERKPSRTRSTKTAPASAKRKVAKKAARANSKAKAAKAKSKRK